MLIDTFDKRGPGLVGLWSIADLRKRIAAARQAGMLAVLGGQITAQQIPQLLPLEADFLAVRGAVCRGDRAARLDPDRVREVRMHLTASQGFV